MSLNTSDYEDQSTSYKNLKNLSQHTQKVSVRKPVKPTSGKVVGCFPSLKSNGSVEWESQMELKACRLFEFCPTVSHFREQPCIVTYELDGSIKKYYPDFELVSASGEITYVEVKPSEKLLSKENVYRFRAIHQHLDEKGIVLIFMTEKHLGDLTVTSNLSLLRAYQQQPITHELENMLYAAKNGLPEPISWLTGLGLSIGDVYTLIANHRLKVNLSKAITPSTVVSIFEESDYENSIFACWSISDLK